jgi:hypothetical protein
MAYVLVIVIAYLVYFFWRGSYEVHRESDKLCEMDNLKRLINKLKVIEPAGIL